MGPILHGKARAILSPENFVVSVNAFAFFETQVYGALLERIRSAIRASMVLCFVHVLSQQLASIVVSEHMCGGVIAEDTGADLVTAKDSLSSGRQDQPDSVFAIPQGAQKPRMIISGRFGLIREPMNRMRHLTS